MEVSALDKAVAAEVEWLRKALSTARMAGASPTRSGKQVQVRVSFRLPGKAVVRCFTARVNWAAGRQPGEPIPFDTFVIDTFNLYELSKRAGVPWNDRAPFQARVVAALAGSGLDAATEPLRMAAARALSDAYSRSMAAADVHEIKRAKAALSKWLLHGFQHGMAEDVAHDLVRQALVRSVLDG